MITEDIDNINTNDIIINKCINNSIIPNSKYYKIIYSNMFFSTYSLYININFNSIKLNLNTNTIYIDNNYHNKVIIDKISYIEHTILNRFIDKKNINYKLTELLNTRYIKYTNKYNNNVNLYNNCYQEYNKSIILKISGIWESNTSYGIIFKFIFI